MTGKSEGLSVEKKTPGQIAFANYTYAQPNDPIAERGWENLIPAVKSDWEDAAQAVIAATAEPWVDRPDRIGLWWGNQMRESSDVFEILLDKEGRLSYWDAEEGLPLPIPPGCKWQLIPQPVPPVTTAAT